MTRGRWSRRTRDADRCPGPASTPAGPDSGPASTRLWACGPSAGAAEEDLILPADAPAGGTPRRDDHRAATASRSSRLAVGLWLAGATLYLATERAAADAVVPRYDYARDYISDLGVAACPAFIDGRVFCSPLHALVNAGFSLKGLLFLLAALAATASTSNWERLPFIAFAALHALGLGLIAWFPEVGREGAGAWHHALGAALAISFGNLAIASSASAFRELRLPIVHRAASIVLPMLTAAALLVLVLETRAGLPWILPVGACERVGVYAITAWELLSAACLTLRCADPRRAAASRQDPPR